MISTQRFLILFLLGLIMLSCNRDEVPEVSCDLFEETLVYDDEVEIIINRSCANAQGCHGSGSVDGDYSSYQKFIDENGPMNFLQRITAGPGDIMPPKWDDTPPLTALELLTLQCWAQGGYLEN